MFTVCLLLMAIPGLAQQGEHDTIRVGSMVVNGDTLPHIWIRDMYVRARAPRWLVRQRRQQARDMEAYNRLRYNVYLTYPYAVAASFILRDVDSMLLVLQSRDAKKLYKERKENELNRRFKGELENMTIEQGQVLVKLIARQTGKPCYQIVRELKGGFNAALWQGVALLFNNNLRNTYDAEGEDAVIESIVQEIESMGHFEVRK